MLSIEGVNHSLCDWLLQELWLDLSTTYSLLSSSRTSLFSSHLPGLNSTFDIIHSYLLGGLLCPPWKKNHYLPPQANIAVILSGFSLCFWLWNPRQTQQRMISLESNRSRPCYFSSVSFLILESPSPPITPNCPYLRNTLQGQQSQNKLLILTQEEEEARLCLS